MDTRTPLPTRVDDLDPEAHARSTDPLTSVLAASRVNLTRRQVQVLEAFKAKDEEDRNIIEGFQPYVRYGFTDEEMVEWVHDHPPRLGSPDRPLPKRPSPSGLRTARKALFDAGLLERAPEGQGLRKTDLGNYAYVWVLTQAGRDFEVPQ